MIKGLSLLQLFNSVEFSIFAKLSICLTLLENISERNSILHDKTFLQQNVNNKKPEKKNDQQEGDRNVSEGFVSPVVKNPCFPEQDVVIAGPSKPKSPRIENSLLESLRASLKEEITSEIRNLLIELQKEMLKLLKPETIENIRDNVDEEAENETRVFTLRQNQSENFLHKTTRT